MTRPRCGSNLIENDSQQTESAKTSICGEGRDQVCHGKVTNDHLTSATKIRSRWKITTWPICQDCVPMMDSRQTDTTSATDKQDRNNSSGKHYTNMHSPLRIHLLHDVVHREYQNRHKRSINVLLYQTTPATLDQSHQDSQQGALD